MEIRRALLTLLSLVLGASAARGADPRYSTRIKPSSQFPVTKLKPGNEQLGIAVRVRGGGGNPIESFAKYVTASKRRCWVLLVIAILLETGSATLIKIARDEKSVSKFATAIGGYFFCLSGFAVSLEHIDVSVAYAVWSALGTSVITVVGILLFNEGVDAVKLLGLAMIISGVILLN